MRGFVRRKGTLVFVVILSFALLMLYSPHFARAQDGEASGGENGPTPTWTPYVVTSTPTPINVFVAAGFVMEATANARTTGTTTPTPANMMTATPTPTFIIVTNTSTPVNGATATYSARLATAIALTTGTPDRSGFVTATNTPIPTPTYTPVPTGTPMPTSTPKPKATPVPPTAEPIPTATPLFILISEIPPRKTSAPRPTPVFPAGLVGRIIFMSNMRDGKNRVYTVNPDGTEIGLLTQRFPYARAETRDAYSADMQFRAFALKEQEFGKKGKVQIFYEWYTYGTVWQTTFFGAGTAWQPAWSPTEDKIAFISNESGNDEIWVVERDNPPAIQLTKNTWEWDHHPSWSPDGKQIVFSSNRTGKRQIWLMNADGSNQRPITPFDFEAWNPVWVKYSDY